VVRGARLESSLRANDGQMSVDKSIQNESTRRQPSHGSRACVVAAPVCAARLIPSGYLVRRETALMNSG